MTEVVKTLPLYDQNGTQVCAIDVAWVAEADHFIGPFFDGMEHTKAQVRAYARAHMVPDESDIADARAA